MREAPLPPDEEERLKALYRYRILDTGPEEIFDDIVEVASHICGVPIVLISLIDPERQWFKAKVGLEASETERSIAFCTHAILDDEIFEVKNALEDERFADNPLVTGEPNIRFYAGAPLITSEGYKLGTLCAIDSKPNELTEHQQKALQALARQARANLDLRLRTERLSTLNKEKNRFFSILAHDLRSPVKSIVGLADFMKEYGAELSPEEQATNFKHIAETAEQVDKLIHDLLEWAQFDRGEMTFNPETIRLKEVMDNVHALLSQASKQKKVAIAFNCPENLEVYADGRMLHSIIQNLVSNALKFTNQHGSIIVTCSGFESKTRIIVEDSGIGMSPKFIDRIFSVGTCFTTEGTSGEKGSGLGLPMCKEFAEKMNGSLAIESARGTGTTATVILPSASPLE